MKIGDVYYYVSAATKHVTSMKVVGFQQDVEKGNDDPYFKNDLGGIEAFERSRITEENGFYKREDDALKEAINVHSLAIRRHEEEIKFIERRKNKLIDRLAKL